MRMPRRGLSVNAVASGSRVDSEVALVFYAAGRSPKAPPGTVTLSLSLSGPSPLTRPHDLTLTWRGRSESCWLQPAMRLARVPTVETCSWAPSLPQCHWQWPLGHACHTLTDGRPCRGRTGVAERSITLGSGVQDTRWAWGLSRWDLAHPCGRGGAAKTSGQHDRRAPSANSRYRRQWRPIMR
jgi:hypothetical protein